MHRTRVFIAVIGAAGLLGGCATYEPSIPPGYTGPTAELHDWIEMEASTKASIFYVASIDGRPIWNSKDATSAASNGQGFRLVPKDVQRKVPAHPMKLEIVGRTYHAAPIQAMVATEYQVKGAIDFVPEEGKTYVVQGKLGEQYSGVWVVEAHSDSVVGQKIEVNGSAALGFFEK